MNAASVREKVSEGEWVARVELAAMFRLAAYYGWEDLLFAHMSARVPGQADRLIINPLALGFEEITASALHTLDAEGNNVGPVAGMPHTFAFHFHRGMYEGFPQAKFAIHLHTKAAIAVSMQLEGLQPSNQYAWFLGPIGYHPYEGLLSSPEEGERLFRNFQGRNAIIQRGHGVIVWGESAAQTFMYAYLLERACEVQVMAGRGELYQPSQDIIELTFKQAQAPLFAGPAPFTTACWQAELRRLDRLCPDYKT